MTLDDSVHLLTAARAIDAQAPSPRDGVTGLRRLDHIARACDTELRCMEQDLSQTLGLAPERPREHWSWRVLHDAPMGEVGYGPRVERPLYTLSHSAELTLDEALASTGRLLLRYMSSRAVLQCKLYVPLPLVTDDELERVRSIQCIVADVVDVGAALASPRDKPRKIQPPSLVCELVAEMGTTHERAELARYALEETRQ